MAIIAASRIVVFSEAHRKGSRDTDEQGHHEWIVGGAHPAVEPLGVEPVVGQVVGLVEQHALLQELEERDDRLDDGQDDDGVAHQVDRGAVPERIAGDQPEEHQWADDLVKQEPQTAVAREHAGHSCADDEEAGDDEDRQVAVERTPERLGVEQEADAHLRQQQPGGRVCRQRAGRRLRRRGRQRPKESTPRLPRRCSRPAWVCGGTGRRSRARQRASLPDAPRVSSAWTRSRRRSSTTNGSCGGPCTS